MNAYHGSPKSPVAPDTELGAGGKGKVIHMKKFYGDNPQFEKSGDGSGLGNKGRLGKLTQRQGQPNDVAKDNNG